MRGTMCSRIIKKFFGKNAHPLYCNSVVTKRLVVGLLREIEKNPNKKFVLFITTNGGDPDAALYFADAVGLCDINLVTIAVGGVYSAGVLLFVSGKTRYATPNTDFMLHKVSGGCIHNGKNATGTEYVREGRNIMSVDKRIESFLSGRCSANKAKIRHMMRLGTYFGVNDAKKIGLVHRVINAKDHGKRHK